MAIITICTDDREVVETIDTSEFNLEKSIARSAIGQMVLEAVELADRKES